MECSPTALANDQAKGIPVAVPINFGMRFYSEAHSSAFQIVCRSPHQFWNALLHFEEWKDSVNLVSQSPSILECASTALVLYGGNGDGVAVPINFGMRFYIPASEQTNGGASRSPHQFWNALLPRGDEPLVQLHQSQSPSILECASTKMALGAPSPGTSRSPHQFWNALLQRS